MNFIDKKFSLEWFIDKIWPIFWVTFGGSLITVASYLTEWIKQYGPLALVVTFFIGSAITLWLYNLALNLRMKATTQKYAAHLMNTNQINILEDKFEKQNLKVNDFFNPYYIPHTNKTIANSIISGPGSLFMPGAIISRCKFYNCQVVLTDATIPIQNITCFRDANITDSLFVGCTLFMNKVHYEEFPDQMKLGLPVISVGLQD